MANGKEEKNRQDFKGERGTWDECRWREKPWQVRHVEQRRGN